MKASHDLVEVSYLPIDVGFDLRRHPTVEIELPAADRLRVTFLQDGDRCTIEGTPAEIAERMHRAGYGTRVPERHPPPAEKGVVVGRYREPMSFEYYAENDPLFDEEGQGRR